MINEIKRQPVTFSLLLVTTVVFMAIQIFRFGDTTSSPTIFEFGGMYGHYLKYDPSQIWRLLTPVFVHIGWQHFLFNIFAIYIVGQLAEQIWGSWRFLLLYLLSGVMGNTVTLFFTPDVVAAGASTSIFGVFAAVSVVGYFGRNPYLKQMGQSYQAIIVVNLIFNLFTPNVSFVGHLGGLVGGLLAAVFLPTISEKHMFKKEQRFLALALYVVLSLDMLFLAL